MLTGDAPDSVALLGAASALGVLGFGPLDYSEANWRQIREMGLLLAGVLVFTRLSRPVASRITGSVAAPGVENSMEATTSPTIESSLIETAGEINIHGSISLSPVRRFTGTAEEPSYWLAGAYDRYTGDGWVRSGTVEAYTEPMSGPPGETQAFDQRFVAESTVQTMLAAWQPVRVGDGVAPLTQVTDLGTFQTSRTFTAGEAAI